MVNTQTFCNKLTLQLKNGLVGYGVKFICFGWVQVVHSGDSQKDVCESFGHLDST